MCKRKTIATKTRTNATQSRRYNNDNHEKASDLSHCISHDGGGGAQAEISDNVVKIGYLADMSGTYRDLSGPNGLKALEMAIADFGGKVDGAKIEIVTADDRNSPDVASTTVRRWVENDNVDMVAGLVAFSVTIAATKVLEESDKLGLVNGSAASSITNAHCTPNHIHYAYDTYALSIGTPTAIVKEGGKTWYILTADYAFGHAMEKDVTRVVEANGGEIVGSIRHPFPTPTFHHSSCRRKPQVRMLSLWQTPVQIPLTPLPRPQNLVSLSRARPLPALLFS